MGFVFGSMFANFVMRIVNKVYIIMPNPSNVSYISEVELQIDMKKDPAVWPYLTDLDPAKSQLDPAKMAGYP